MKLSIPLHAGFRFLHEPQYCFSEDWFIGRKDEVDELVRRLQHSDGGSFLVTGYRGVGKTSFVNRALDILGGRVTLLDVHLNLARQLLPAELMHLIVRHLYERLIEKDIYRLLSPELQESITLAYQRTSANVVRKLSQGSEMGMEAGASLGVKLPFTPKLALKRSRSIDLETSFIAYDDRSAEHDIVAISHVLAAGIPEHCSMIKRILNRLAGATPRRIPLKVVFVFDEMDKIDDPERGQEDTSPSQSSVEQMLSGLKTLFTTSGICFVFIAGKDLHERWVRDLRRGDSVYESIFSYDKYLPCMWSDIDQICDRFAIAPPGTRDPSTAELLPILKQYLRFMGRGMPRRFLRSFNGMVKWRNEKPEIPFENEDLRRVTFFAHLNEALESNSEKLFGNASEDLDGTRQDRRRLGVYYVVDWILRKGKSSFSAVELLAASHALSARIAFAEEIAAGAVEVLIDVLVRADYIELVPPRLDDVIVGPPIGTSEKKYRLTARRVAEISGIPSVLDDSISTTLTENLPPRPLKGLPKIGRFVTEEIIGTGGMGTVYRALDPMRQRRVALKVMRDAFPEVRVRFLREIKILETLRHENIVRFLEAGEGDSLLYFTMDLIEGSDLRLILTALGHLSPESALAILLPIGRAIAFAHRSGYVRLDLKPGNVQVSYAGQVFLLDMSIAREVEREVDSTLEITQAGSIVGTPAYMAPDHFRGVEIDARADIYAYGVVLYETLTGALPFSGRDFETTMMKHLTEIPRPLREIAPDIPAWLDAIVMRCLQKDPKHRFQSMDDLLREADSFAGNITAPVEIGSIARQARQKALKLENSRNAQTLRGPGDFTAEFGSSRPPSPSAPASFAPPPPTRVTTGRDAPTRIYPAALTSAPSVVNGPTAIFTPRPSQTAPPGTKPRLFYGDPSQAVSSSTSLASGRTRIGSALDNDIVLEKEDVSRYHAQIENIEGTFLLVDLNSSKGTYLNGNRVLRPQQLNPNDTFRISTTHFTFVA